MLGRGYEYMYLEAEEDADAARQPVAVGASQRGAATQGFTAGVHAGGAVRPAGLSTAADDEFGGRATNPMMPNTWPDEQT